MSERIYAMAHRDTLLLRLVERMYNAFDQTRVDEWMAIGFILMVLRDIVRLCYHFTIYTVSDVLYALWVLPVLVIVNRVREGRAKA